VPPIVIGKAAKPRCFKCIRNLKKPHGVPYYSNAKAWMNNELMTTLLATSNRWLLRTGKKILLLMDNVSSHDPALQEKFFNIKVVFLPINTTSKLQPLDAGIIKNFKCHYMVKEFATLKFEVKCLSGVFFVMINRYLKEFGV